MSSHVELLRAWSRCECPACAAFTATITQHAARAVSNAAHDHMLATCPAAIAVQVYEAAHGTDQENHS